jgi:hypothetical protein
MVFIEMGCEMVREITSHRINGVHELFRVVAMDELGAGGASHEYMIRLDTTQATLGSFAWCSIKFQKGSFLEVGVNGITNKTLLAIVGDRLASFQAGPFACHENAVALTKIQEAMMALQWRTRFRIMRGVEGTSNL